MSTMKDQDTVKTVNEQGQPVAKRIDTVGTAVAVYERFKKADEELARDREKVQGQINGNRPYNAAKLRALGQGWRANFNAGEAEATRDSNAASYWSLLMDGPSLVQARILNRPNDPTELDYAQIIAEEYSETMTEWAGFFHNVLLHSTELFTFGKGPMCWVDRFDWRFKAFKDGQVLLSPHITSDVGSIEIFFVRDTITATQLSRIILDPEVYQRFGWSPKVAAAAMRRKYVTQEYVPDEIYQRDPLSSLQQQIRNRDSMLPFWDVEPVAICHAFIRQVKSGKVSHFAFEDRGDAKEYLLEANDVFDDIQNVLCMFTNGIGDGYMRSIRGLGQKMFPHIEVSNRFICTTIDTARISSGLVLSGSDKDDPKLKMIGPIVQLPAGAVPVQTSFTPRLDQVIAVRTMLQQILNNNFGVYQRAMEYPNMPDRTKAEVVIAEEKEARFSNFAIVIYYTHWDRCHREIFRRLTAKDYPAGHPGYAEAMDFRKRCIDRGVPPELLDPKRCRIKTMRAIGAGSPALRKLTTSELMGTISMLPYKGQMALLAEYYAARVGYSNIERFGLSPKTLEQTYTAEHTIATLETNDMAEGTPMEVPQDQPHLIHLEVHFAPLLKIRDEALMAVKGGQQIDASRILPYFEVSIPHLQRTLEFALADPRYKAKAKEYDDEFQSILDTYAGLRREEDRRQKMEMAAMEQQAAEMEQQMAQQANPELQAKLEKVRGELAIRAQKVEGEMRIREFKARHDAMLKEFRLKSELEQKAMKTQQEMNSMQAGGRLR